MAKTAVVTSRIEPSLKQEVEGILSNLGMTTSQAILIYFRQIALHHGLPFAVQIPNQATMAAIRESADTENMPSFDSLDELFADLEI